MKADERRAMTALKALKPRIRDMRENLDAEVAYRDACIKLLAERGWSERDIADLAGVSNIRVHQILNPKEEASAGG